MSFVGDVSRVITGSRAPARNGRMRLRSGSPIFDREYSHRP